MYYKESKKILEEIKKTKKILINCHRGPDMDSVGSALAMSYVLEKLGKKITLICPSENINGDLAFLKNYEKIQKKVDFKTFNFSEYDLLVAIDSASWGMVSGDENIQKTSLPIIVIDHHHTNTKYGYINLIDENASSVGELTNRLFSDWKVKINKDTATALLTGIIGDTGIFKYPNTTDSTFLAAHSLMEKGADKEKIIANTYRNYDFRLIKFCGEVLNNAVVDEKNKFVYSFVPFETFEKWGKPENAKEIATDLFAQSTKGTNFGLVGLEKEKGKISISLRSKNDFDTSILATALGGGGHKAASGGKMEGLPFDEAVKKVLQVTIKYAKQT